MSPADAIAQHLGIAGASGGAIFVAFVCAAILAYGRTRDRGTVAELDGFRGTALQVGLWVTPTLLVVALFLTGLRGYVSAAVPPGDALQIAAKVENDHWSFDYGGGVVAEDALRLPLERPVHLILRSEVQPTRVAVPALHLDLEVRPGAEASAWWIPGALGELPVMCATCSAAPPSIVVMPAFDFDKWREDADGGKLPPAEYGAKLYARSQCQTCHSLDGTVVTGPSFKGIFGKQELLADGSEILVDAAYVTESILDPGAKVVRGFQPLMPSFRGQLNDKQIAALVAFVEAQKP